MTDAFRLRPGGPDDSRAAFDIFLAAIRDLTARQGLPWDPDPERLWTSFVPMMEHLAAHAAEWWVAEDPTSGEAIGYARSVERGGLFELSEFFVRPDRQAAGVGGALLERAFPAGRGEVRAIIATADPRAVARYYRAGTVARFPIMSLMGAPQRIGAVDDVEVVRASASDIAELRRIEAAVLDYDRGDEFAFLLDQREGYLYRRGGGAIGFAFVGAAGTGPIAALEPADQGPILAHLEDRAAELGLDEITFEVPLVNEVAVRHLLDRRMQFDPFLTLFMSSRPFGRFDRFIGYAPPFVL